MESSRSAASDYFCNDFPSSFQGDLIAADQPETFSTARNSPLRLAIDGGKVAEMMVEDQEELHQEHYPHYGVRMGRSPGLEEGPGGRLTTIGDPLRVSHSLLGRGICVWQAALGLGPKKIPLVLKVSWRAPERSETDSHDVLRSFLRKAGVEEPRGLALATPAGGDVYNDDETRRIMPHKSVVDSVLHRIRSTRLGKPIWEYSSFQEFARAMRDAVQAHEVLSSHGVLHRDISASNILIDVDVSCKAATATEPEGIILKDRDPQNASGFLTGWKSAWFPQDILDVAADRSQADLQPVEPDPDSPMKVTSGDTITSTAIFFATEVLLGLRAHRQLVRNKVHDIESFEWVILFAVYKHSIESARKCFYGQAAKEWESTLTEEFRHIFPSVGAPSALADNRIVALKLPSFHDGDYFEKIRRLLAFLERVVGSGELLDFLMDIWEDLMYRCWVVSFPFRAPPVRPGSMLRDENRPVLAVSVKRHLGHEDLIWLLENLILHV